MQPMDENNVEITWQKHPIELYESHEVDVNNMASAQFMVARTTINEHEPRLTSSKLSKLVAREHELMAHEHERINKY